jgi:hypothetical protein
MVIIIMRTLSLLEGITLEIYLVFGVFISTHIACRGFFSYVEQENLQLYKRILGRHAPCILAPAEGLSNHVSGIQRYRQAHGKRFWLEYINQKLFPLK